MLEDEMTAAAVKGEPTELKFTPVRRMKSTQEPIFNVL